VLLLLSDHRGRPHLHLARECQDLTAGTEVPRDSRSTHRHLPSHERPMATVDHSKYPEAMTALSAKHL
jgi:hypothetical protein